MSRPGQQRRAQQRLGAVERVFDLDGVAGQTGPLEVAGCQERGGPRLGQPGAGQDVADPSALPLVGGEAAAGADAGRQGPLDAAVAVQPGHLLDDVDLPLAVGPPGRDGHLQHARAPVAGDVAKPIGASRRGDVGVGERGAEDGVDPLGADRDGAGDRAVCSAERTSARGAPAHAGQQRHEPVDGQVDDLGVDAPLEAGPGLGAAARAACRCGRSPWA